MCHWGGRECVLTSTRWCRVPGPEGPELISLGSESLCCVPCSPWPPSFGALGSPLEAGTGPLQPPHQHRAHLNWTSRPPSPPSSARGRGFKAAVPQVPGLGPDREPPPSPW
uniref:Uncharacterized protein n=1 Tax=Pan paniscus TaxID=9597 RepID=A0A2R8ZC58_PANPA